LVKVTGAEVVAVPSGTLPKLIFLGETLTFGSFASGDDKKVVWALATLPAAPETAQIRIATAATRCARAFKVLIVFTKMC
jgi:hypothetical protein